jgi:hypothetical protein
MKQILFRSSLRLGLMVAALLLGCAAPRLRAEGTNGIAYKDFNEIFQPISTVDASKLQLLVFVSSTNKSVQRSNITLTIQSRLKGPIPLTIDTNGQILKFPLDKDLLTENPPIHANQPKGSLRLFVTMQITPPDGLVFRYNRLGDGVAEMNKTIREQAGWALSLMAPKAKGVVFVFPEDRARKARVEVMAAAGRQFFLADTNGVVKVKLEKSLLSENPEVKMSEKPEQIVPDFE